MAFDNLSREQVEELRRKARQRAVSPTTPEQSGSQAFQQSKDVPITAPFDLGRFAQSTVQGAGATAGFGLDMIKGAGNQLGKAASSAFSGVGDFFNEQGQRLGAIGALSQGKSEEAKNLLTEAERNKTRAQLKLTGAAGDVIGAAGAGVLGAGAAALSPIAGTAYGTGQAIIDAADVTGQLTGMPGIRSSVESTLGNIGSGAADLLGRASEALGSGAADMVGLQRDPFTGGQLFTDQAERRELGEQGLAATNVLGVTTGGVTSALAKNTIRSLSATKAGQAMGNILRGAQNITKAKKGLSGAWLDDMGDVMRQAYTRFHMGVDGASLDDLQRVYGISKDVDMKQFARLYTKARADEFLKTPFGMATQAVAKVGAPIARNARSALYNLSPVSIGVRSTTAMSKYAYNTIRKALGGRIADDVLMKMDTPMAKVYQDMILTPKDMNVFQGMVNTFKNVNASQISTAINGAREFVESAATKLTKATGVKGIGESYRGFTQAVDEIISGLQKNGMGIAQGFTEKSKTVLRDAQALISKSNLSPEFSTSIRSLIQHLGANGTVGDLVSAKKIADDLLKGTGLTAEELASNKQFISQLRNAITYDMKTTAGMYDDGIKQTLDGMDGSIDDMVRGVKEEMAKKMETASTGTEKMNIFRREVVDALDKSDLDAADLSMLADRLLTEFQGFFENGVMALRDLSRGTKLEKLFANSKVMKAMTPDEYEDIARSLDGIYEPFDTKAPPLNRLMESTIDAFKSANARFGDVDNITQNVLRTQSDEAIDLFARSIELDPGAVKLMMSGNADLMKAKADMFDVQMLMEGKNISNIAPKDIMGRYFITQTSGLLENTKDMVMKNYKRVLDTNKIKSVDATSAINNLELSLQENLGIIGAFTDEPTILDSSILSTLTGDARKLKVEIDFLNRNVKTRPDGSKYISLEALDNFETTLREMPGRYNISEVGEMRDRIENVFGRFREDLRQSLPQEVADAQAAYALTMDGVRSFYKLLGASDKMYNRMTAWVPEVSDATQKRAFLNSAAKAAGKNFETLQKEGIDKVDNMLREVLSLVSQDSFGPGLYDDIYNLANFNSTLRSLGGSTRINLGNQAALRAESSLATNPIAQFIRTYKNRGAEAAIGGVITGSKPDIERLKRIGHLIRIQAKMVAKDPDAAYFSPTALSEDIIGLTPHKDKLKHLSRYLSIEDTAQADEYTQDVGMKGMVLNKSSQSLPDNALNNMMSQSGVDTPPAGAQVDIDKDDMPF